MTKLKVIHLRLVRERFLKHAMTLNMHSNTLAMLKISEIRF